MMQKQTALFVQFLCAALLSAVHVPIAAACPDIDGIVDWNCDGKIAITTFGDSITYGIGDSSRLGYPGRLRRLLPEATVYNFGDPGEETAQGRSRAPKRFRQKRNADFVIILEGVNDYFDDNRSPFRTRDNLFSMVHAAESEGAIAILAKLTSTRRSFQIGWVKGVNSAIGHDGHTRLDFFSLGTRIIGSDKLHPNGRGYQSMAELAQEVLETVGSRLRPRDSDHDGIYDFAESRFGTNSRVADSDGDGVVDGDEVFVYHSNPLSRDSDGDGFEDGYEVNTLHSNPADPRPTAPTLQSIEITAAAS